MARSALVPDDRTVNNSANSPIAPSAPAGPGRLVDQMVDATPVDRDRTVDLLRAVAITTVVVWHWALSLTHWNDGRLTMPNPIDSIRGGWALTWLLQVMPLFFLAGGYANLAAYTANAARNGSDAGFVRSRLRRLVIPCLPMIGAWAVVHVLTTHLGHATSVWHWGRIVFVALWFLAAYGTVTTLVPITARLHRRAPWTTLAGMVGGVAVLDLIRFTSEVVVVGGVVNSLAVFVVVQQLGYFWRDHACTVTARTSWLVVAAGVALLVVMTTVGPYPASMVATGSSQSNMFPTSAAIAAVGVLQLGLAFALRPALLRMAQRRRVWTMTIGVNAVAMTVFAWHMTAVAICQLAFTALGGTLGARPTASWWATRPLWILGPGLVLAIIIAAVGRLEFRVRDTLGTATISR